MIHSKTHSNARNAGIIPSSGLFVISAILAVFLFGMVFLSSPAVVEGSWNASVVPPAAVIAIQEEIPEMNSLPVSQALPVIEAPIVQASVAPVAPVVVPAVVAVTAEVPKSSETYLAISKIHVNAIVRTMGFTDTGAMAVPDSTVDVGWFGLGTRPGNEGSAVIGGHNWWNDADGVFVNLDQLVQGDIISVIDPDGNVASFVVREKRTYSATADATDIFLSQGGAHLNLITCSGEWDPATQSFTTRLVVFADAISE